MKSASTWRTPLPHGALELIGSGVVRDLWLTRGGLEHSASRGANARNLDGLDVDRVEVDDFDPRAMTRALSGCDALYHRAAIDMIWTLDPESMHRVNVEGTVTTLFAARAAGVKRIIDTSSITAIGLPPHRGDRAPDATLADQSTPFNLRGIANDYLFTR